MTHLIIFDVDGTLVDSQNIILAAQARAFAAHDMPALERTRALSVVGLSLIESFTQLAGPDAPAASLAEAYKDAFHVLRDDPAMHEPFFPGAQETVNALAQRDDVVLAIATGKSRRGVAYLVERAGWHNMFASVQTADTNASKPSPAMILAAIAEAGVDAANTTMIGDTSFDMDMARTAGVYAQGVGWGYHPRAALIAAGAQDIADDFAALRGQLVQRLSHAAEAVL